MLELILAISLPPVIGYIIDRWGYNRTIVKAAERALPAIPNADVRKAAEQAIILANQHELARAVAKLEERQRMSKLRQGAIESGGGAVHIGNLRRDE